MLPYLAPNIRREKHQNQSWQTNGKRDCRGGESQRDVNPAASEREVNHGLDVAESILAVSNLNRPTKLSLRDVETGPQEHDGVEQKCCDQKCAVSISWRRMATNAKSAFYSRGPYLLSAKWANLEFTRYRHEPTLRVA